MVEILVVVEIVVEVVVEIVVCLASGGVEDWVEECYEGQEKRKRKKKKKKEKEKKRKKRRRKKKRRRRRRRRRRKKEKKEKSIASTPPPSSPNVVNNEPPPLDSTPTTHYVNLTCIDNVSSFHFPSVRACFTCSFVLRYAWIFFALSILASFLVGQIDFWNSSAISRMRAGRSRNSVLYVPYLSLLGL